MIKFELENVSIKVENDTFFNNISYKFIPSKFYALLGDSNSGKTVFINALMRHMNISEGIIRINNVLSTSYQAEEHGIYLLNQEPNFFKHLTVLENLFPDDTKKTKELLVKFGLNFDVKTPLSSLKPKDRIKIKFIRYLTFENLSLLFIDDFSLLKMQVERLFLNIFFNELKVKFITVIMIDYEISNFYINYIDEILLIRNKSLDVLDKNKYLETYHANNRKKRVRNEIIDISLFNQFEFYNGKIYGIICNEKNKKKQLGNYLSEVYSNITFANLNSTDSLFYNLSIFENTVVSSKRIKTSRFFLKHLELLDLQKERKKIESLIKKLNLAKTNIDTNISELGLGDQKKIILARYLLSGYETLIIFNLFNSIDNSTKVDVINLLLQYNRMNKTVIIIDNNLHDLDMICNKIFKVV